MMNTHFHIYTEPGEAGWEFHYKCNKGENWLGRFVCEGSRAPIVVMEHPAEAEHRLKAELAVLRKIIECGWHPARDSDGYQSTSDQS